MGKATCARTSVAVLLAAVCASATPPARASDGAIEIDAARAAAGGVTPGDAPGFPVTLSQPGSYVLTGNLAQTNPALPILQVTADDVAIDLAGFVLSGPVLCTGRPVTSCLPAGAGAAIAASTASRVAVHDGAVRGTARGIELGPGCVVERVRVRSAGGPGISCAGIGGAVRESVASGNGGVGFSLGSGSLEDAVADGNASHGVLGDDASVSNVSTTANGGRGIFSASGVTAAAVQASSNTSSGVDLGPASLVTNVAAISNGGAGIATGAGSLVAASAARTNGGAGIAALGEGSSIVGSAASANTGGGLAVGAGGQLSGSAAFGNTGVGVTGGAACRVFGNTSVLSTGYGATLGNGCGYGANVLAGNGGAPEQQITPPGPGVTLFEIDPNVCGANLTCP